MSQLGSTFASTICPFQNKKNSIHDHMAHFIEQARLMWIQGVIQKDRNGNQAGLYSFIM